MLPYQLHLRRLCNRHHQRNRTFAAFTVLMLICAPTLQADEKVSVVSTGTEASFRGIGMAAELVFAGGSESTLVRSMDNGTTWSQLKVTDDADLDFRDIEALGDGSLLLMSAGLGEKSRIFRSVDGGDSWECVWTNKHEKGFFNGLAVMQSGKRCVVIGDPVGDTLYLLNTEDGGDTWKEIPGPAGEKGEYGFAASGTGIQFSNDGRIMIATGGAKARVFQSKGGKRWGHADSGLRHGNESSGIFSLSVRGNRAVVIGGDYLKPDESKNNAAWSTDGGKSFTLSESLVPHKACVRFIDDQRVLAVGRTGVMTSFDAGKTWKTISTESFYTFVIDADAEYVHMAGADGRTGRLKVADLVAR